MLSDTPTVSGTDFQDLLAAGGGLCLPQICAEVRPVCLAHLVTEAMLLHSLKLPLLIGALLDFMV